MHDAENSQKLSSVETEERLKQLTKEKDEMLALAMQRGKLIQACTIYYFILYDNISAITALYYHADVDPNLISTLCRLTFTVVSGNV